MTAEQQELGDGSMSGENVAFLTSLLAANASWSASIHNAALDGQERASNEWAARYLSLVKRVENLARRAWRLTPTELSEELNYIAQSQGFYPDLAGDQLNRYRERQQAEKEARAAASAGS